ncbi:DUF3293 domain-containing protein [Nitrosomonas sp.]|uniref:DUF3293 domain-containing protein n=1 Tax=Nitrosomonas sp. TaxID=42353 RepID=UPI0025E13D4D|nr:DUF3293 domain-containing protein [Nitrosomonas sp.]
MIIRMNNPCNTPDEINAVSSAIARDLIDSYCNTIYRVDIGSEPIALRIDQFSRLLSNFLSERKHSCAAIISAYNPYSQQLSNDENEAAHHSLRELLSHRSYPIVGSVNIDPLECWPVEKSFLVMGVDLETAKFIGYQYCQNAIVWIDGNAVPYLVLLR